MKKKAYSACLLLFGLGSDAGPAKYTLRKKNQIYIT